MIGGSVARGVRAAVAVILVTTATVALSGPVEVYREGAYCPRDRSSSTPAMTEAQAIARARALLPDGFCGPDTFVSGCDFLAEYTFDSWRVYAHQYKDRGGRHDWSALTHTYVILDPVGNCLANIPGTELGGR